MSGESTPCPALAARPCLSCAHERLFERARRGRTSEEGARGLAVACRQSVSAAAARPDARSSSRSGTATGLACARRPDMPGQRRDPGIAREARRPCRIEDRPSDGRPNLALMSHFGRIESAVAWMNALSFSTSSGLILPVKSGIPRPVAGPSKTNFSRCSI